MKMNEAKKTMLKDFMVKSMGAYDMYEIEGYYGYSYDATYEDVVMYRVIKDRSTEEGYSVEECVLRSYEIDDILGGNFFDNAHSTKIKKVRKYFRDYVCY